MSTVGTMAFAAPSISDGVTQEEEVNITTLGNTNKSFVSFFPAFISRRRLGGRVFFLGFLSRSNRNEGRKNRTQEGEF